jgi:DNA polymerase III delta prime subunit
MESDTQGSTGAGRDGGIGRKISNFFSGSTEQQRAQRNRQAMLQLMKNTWVKGALEQSLHGAAMIELGLEERAELVEPPWDMLLRMPDRPSRALPPGTQIVHVFEKMSCSLLILGEPGSGKTTTLLELARDLIACAERDPSQAIPVVLNLSSWPAKRQPLTDWLVEELTAKYYIPKGVARPWVENDELVLLLDGLDEVKSTHRDACVRTINDFRRQHGLTPVAVCSRSADYESLATKLAFQGAVLIQPLTLSQVDDYLAGAGLGLAAVRTALQHDAALQELAQSPLMLSIMTLAYKGGTDQELEVLDTLEVRRKHLLDAYIGEMFKRRLAGRPFPQEQTIHWLAWLAQGMIQHAQPVFLIELLQPSWLRTHAERRLFAVVIGLLLGLLVGLTIGQVNGPVGGLIKRVNPRLCRGDAQSLTDAGKSRTSLA